MNRLQIHNILICVLVALFLTGCTEQASSLDLTPDFYLQVSDSIGVEIGDSNYVFALPVYSCFLPSGDIAVIDQMKKKILLYSNEGHFIDQLGREGNGPGEYLLPAGVTTTPSGEYAVNAAMHRQILFYDEYYQYTRCTGVFFPYPPSNPSFISDSLFVGNMVVYEMSDEELKGGFSISLFNTGSITPEITYYSDVAPIDIENPFDAEITQPLFAVAADGTVFISILSETKYEITAYSLAGEELYDIVEDYSRLEKAPEVIEEETRITREIMSRSGMPEYMLESIQATPFYYSIDQMSIGPDGNLWVSQGYYDYSVYKVYNVVDGTYLYSVALNEPDLYGHLDVTVTRWGITAINRFTETYPKIYILVQTPQSS